MKHKEVQPNPAGFIFDDTDMTRMLEKRRQLYEIEEAFALQGEEYHNNMEKLKLQEETIKKTDNKIQEKFIRHCKFLAENKDKRTRAKRHLEEERKIKEGKLHDIYLEEETLKQLDSQRELLESKIGQLSCFEEFLLKVVEIHNDQYADIRDLLHRFHILQQSNQRFKDQKQDLELLIGDLSSQKVALEKNKNFEIMILSNEIANLQKQFDGLELKNLKTLDEIKSEETNVLSKMGTLAKLIMAVENLHDICKKSEIKTFKEKGSDQNAKPKSTYTRVTQESNKLQENIFAYNIGDVMEKLKTIENTSEAIKLIVEMSGSKKEFSKTK